MPQARLRTNHSAQSRNSRSIVSSIEVRNDEPSTSSRYSTPYPAPASGLKRDSSRPAGVWAYRSTTSRNGVAHAVEHLGQLIGGLLGEHLDKADVGAFVEDDAQDPLFFDQGDEDVFAHALLEQHAEIFFAQELGDLAGRSEGAGDERAERGDVLVAVALVGDHLAAFIEEQGVTAASILDKAEEGFLDLHHLFGGHDQAG